MKREELIRELRERYRTSGRSFNEFERRHWAALEAMKIGWGGISIVATALRISPNTIRKGVREIAAGQADADRSPENKRIRKAGGGRKPRVAPTPVESGDNTHGGGGVSGLPSDPQH